MLKVDNLAYLFRYDGSVSQIPPGIENRVNFPYRYS